MDQPVLTTPRPASASAPSRAGIDADALVRRVQEMLSTGRLGVARPLLAALRRLRPDSGAVVELEARLMLSEDRGEDALMTLAPAIAREPGSAALRRRRAAALVSIGNPAAALPDLAEAVVLEPDNAEGLTMLGALLTGLDRAEEAIICLERAVALAPRAAGAWRALAGARARLGGDAQAAATYEAGIAACPNDIALRTAAITLALGRDDAALAARLAADARSEGVVDAGLFALAGDALAALDRPGDAAEAYGEAAKLAPEDPVMRALGPLAEMPAVAPQLTAELARRHYDALAVGYDERVIAGGYRVPGLLRGLLNGVPVGGPVLDLGCGSGLAAIAVGDLVEGRIEGVDVSPAMLAVARERNLYSALHEAELTEFLRADGGQWGMIIAADVLCHFGALDAVLRVIAPRLAAEGRLLFSLAGGHGAAGERQRRGRFGHGEAAIREALAGAGLVAEHLEASVLYHGERPGWIVAARR